MRIVTLAAIVALIPSAVLAAGVAPANATQAAPAASTQAAATAAKSDEEQLKDLEQQWLDAALKHDTQRLDALLANDFQDVSWQGQLRSKADVMAATAVPVTTTQTLSELKVRVHGDLGVVTGVNTTEAADKSFTVKVRFTDVFVKLGGQWHALSAQETIEKNG